MEQSDYFSVCFADLVETELDRNQYTYDESQITEACLAMNTGWIYAQKVLRFLHSVIKS